MLQHNFLHVCVCGRVGGCVRARAPHATPAQLHCMQANMRTHTHTHTHVHTARGQMAVRNTHSLQKKGKKKSSVLINLTSRVMKLLRLQHLWLANRFQTCWSVNLLQGSLLCLVYFFHWSDKEPGKRGTRQPTDGSSNKTGHEVVCLSSATPGIKVYSFKSF